MQSREASYREGQRPREPQSSVRASDQGAVLHDRVILGFPPWYGKSEIRNGQVAGDRRLSRGLAWAKKHGYSQAAPAQVSNPGRPTTDPP